MLASVEAHAVRSPPRKLVQEPSVHCTGAIHRGPPPAAPQLALKVERRPDVRTVKQECKVLRHLQGCSKVTRVHDSGSHQNLHFMVMDLLGPNLADARRAEPEGRVAAAAAKVVGASLLAALQQLHRAGYIHRDVKPANFAVSPPSAALTLGEWVLIDFGLARKFVDDAGRALAEREDASFRGTTTYASVHAHDDKDLSRRDDLWGWFYMLVELLEGEAAASMWNAQGAACCQPHRGISRSLS
jgi:tau tubulin kinase